MPGAGFVTMGLEALYQKYCALLQPEASMVPSRNDLCYRFRNVRFNRAMVLEEGRDVMVSTTLMPVSGSKDWHQFSISSTEADVVSEHCSGLVRIQESVDQPATGIGSYCPLSSYSVWNWNWKTLIEKKTRALETMFRLRCTATDN